MKMTFEFSGNLENQRQFQVTQVYLLLLLLSGENPNSVRSPCKHLSWLLLTSSPSPPLQLLIGAESGGHRALQYHFGAGYQYRISELTPPTESKSAFEEELGAICVHTKVSEATLKDLAILPNGPVMCATLCSERPSLLAV